MAAAENEKDEVRIQKVFLEICFKKDMRHAVVYLD